MPSTDAVHLVSRDAALDVSSGVLMLHFDLECQRVRACFSIKLDPRDRSVEFCPPFYSREVHEL